MEKIERFEVIDRCLFWRERKILIVGDLHLGYEETLREGGLFFPESLINSICESFDKIFKKTGKLKKIIFLGDIKHYFKGILKSEYKDFYRLINKIKKRLYKNGHIIITEGNHDKILKPIIERKEGYSFVLLKPYHIEEDVLFFHGNIKKNIWKESFFSNKKIKEMVVGHFHPAITLQKQAKKEKYKIFLFGKIKNKKIIILPSFFPLNEGSDILNHKQLILESGLKVDLKKIDLKIKNLKVFILDNNGKVYYFGDLEKLRKLIN
jgi:uncharacterized protein